MSSVPDSSAQRVVGDDDTALSCRVSCALTHRDRERVRAKAASAGLTVSEFLLLAALGARISDTFAFKNAWVRLAPLSGNFHQILKHLNYKRAAGEDHDADVLGRLLELIPRIGEAVGQLRHELRQNS